MKIATSVWTGVALLAMAQAAQAAPKVAGTYALMSFEQCTARFVPQIRNYLMPPADAPTIGSAIRVIDPTISGDGELNIGVGIISFPATGVTSGDMSIDMTIVGGDVVKFNTPYKMTVHTESLSGTFSFTNATFTFTPTGKPAMTWTMRPGNIVSGVARTLYMVRRENAQCLNAITATKQ